MSSVKLEEQTNEQLKDIIRKYNLTHHIRGYSKMKKVDLISNIRKHMKPEPVEENINIIKQKDLNDTYKFTKVGDRYRPNWLILDAIKRISGDELGETKKEKIKYEKEFIETLKSIKNIDIKNKIIKEIEKYDILDEANITVPLRKAIEDFIKPEIKNKTITFSSKELDKLLGKNKL